MTDDSLFSSAVGTLLVVLAALSMCKYLGILNWIING